MTQAIPLTRDLLCAAFDQECEYGGQGVEFLKGLLDWFIDDGICDSESAYYPPNNSSAKFAAAYVQSIGGAIDVEETFEI